MTTSTAARIVKLDALVGSLGAGKRADFMVPAAPGTTADPYGSLSNARETDLHRWAACAGDLGAHVGAKRGKPFS